MANPLAVFRKYQKILLVVFGVALMLVFTVGEIISQYMYRGNLATENPVVVTIGADELRESDLQSLHFARYHLRNFMQAVNLYAAQAGATPQQGIGISDTDAEADLVQTAILARKAQEMGMVVSDQAIIDYLTRYSQGKLAPGDFARILRDVSQSRMSQNQFFDAMRRELLAQQYLAVQQEGMMPPTPAGMWEYFLRLNRKISFEAVPFEVADYVDQVPEPSDAQITALYDEGKERYPFPDRAEPGFKRLKRVAMQYVKADLNDFLEEAKAQLTPDEIRAYYETNQEEFRRFDLPGLDDSTTPSGQDQPAADGSVPGEPSEAQTEASESGADAASETNGVAPADDERSADELPAEATDDQETDDQTAVPADNGADGDTPADNSLNRSTHPAPFATVPVAARQEATTDEVPAPAEAESTAAAADLPAADAETPLAETPETGTPTEPTDSPLAVPAEQAGEQPRESTDTPDPLGDLPEPAGSNAPTAGGEYQTLEEATDTIRTRLATPIARQKMDQALNVLRSEMKSYASRYLAWEVSGESEASPAPTPPDLRALADQHRLTVGTVPLVTIFELQTNDPVTGEPLHEISRAFDTNLVPFAQYMFSDDLRRYEVRSIRGQLLDTEYLYWKTDEVPEKVLELSEVRDDVIHALKVQDALELANKDAQQAAEQLNANNQRPQDVYANDPNRKVINAESVTWMTGTNLPYLPPRPTRIPGIEYPGDAFMSAVFSLPPGKAGVAVDNPQDTVYVVQVSSVESDEEQLRQQFLLTGPTAETAQLAQRDAQRHLQQWYQSLEDELGVKWHRDAHPDSRAR